MKPQLSPGQLVLLVGGTLLVGILLAVLIYAAYKMLRREKKEEEWKPARPRGQDDAAFMVGAMQGIITRLKTQEKALTEHLRQAEQRAEASEQKLGMILREMPLGVLMFNREGFLVLANPAARVMLEIDTWSRRRYPEILGPESALAGRIGECLETGKACKEEGLEYRTASGNAKALDVSLTPYSGSNGQREGVLCLLDDGSRSRRTTT